MPTITIKKNKILTQIIALPFDLYLRADGGQFTGVGHVQRDSCIINLQPMLANVEDNDHATNYQVKIRTVIAQTDIADIDFLASLKNAQQVDALFYFEPFHLNNFILEKVSFYAEGDVPIAYRKARTIPVVLSGHFLNIDKIFKSSVIEAEVTSDYFVEHDTKITAALTDFAAANLTAWAGDGPSQNVFDTSKGAHDGYYKETANYETPYGFSANSLNFSLKCKTYITSLTGREIGLAIATKSAGLGGTSGFGYLFLKHNGKLNIYEVTRSSGAVALKKTLNLIHVALSQIKTFEAIIIDHVVKFYDHGEYVGSYTIPNPDNDGYMIGVAVKDNNGTGSEASFLYDVIVKTDAV